MIDICRVALPNDFQMDIVINGVRNSYDSHNKSDSGFNQHDDYILGEEDLKLLKRLMKAGSSDRKFLRMLPVVVDINAPLYWWKEFDTYKVGTTANSESTMHSIAKKPFSIYDFSFEHLSGSAEKVMDDIIEVLNRCRECYLAAKNPDEKKKYWWHMIQLLPSSYNQKRTVALNYEVLLKMWQERKNHKLDEWREFCEWIEENIICYFDEE